jgi:hypothetical protein
MNTYTTAPTPGHGAPESFLSRFGQKITGVLSGFDRLLFRGSLRLLFQPNSMESYLATCGVLIKDFGSFSQKITKRVKGLAYEAAEQQGRPVQYLNRPDISKEELARQIAGRDGVQSGLVALFTAVEPCWSYAVRGDRQTKEIHLALEMRKCTHLYHYYMHPQFGLMHVRVQSWFPFSVTVCLNGREWLARQMDQAGIAYQQQDNCFLSVSDPVRAQELLDQQLHTDWNATLRGLLAQAHPLHAELERPFHQEYYWSAAQTEYATDLMFADPASLAQLYPQFLHHAIRSFGSQSVLRFLGKAKPQGFRGEVTSTLKRRPEGVCLRHTVNGNSIKVYDKQGSVLRVETTVVHPEQFKVYRPAEGAPEEKLKWRKVRRGIADLWRRGEVSRAANGRYLTALASVSGSTPLKAEAGGVCQRVKVEGQSYRALNPWSEADGALLEAISRGEYTINGFRNRDLRKALYTGQATVEQERKRSGAVSRKLALLRAHGLIKKVNGTHRWLLTEKGRRIVTALLAARHADVDKLTQLAA